MLNQICFSSLRGVAQLLLGIGLASLVLASVMIPVTVSAPEEPASHATEVTDRANETFDQAVVRAGSGTILQVGSPITLPIEASQVQDLGTARVVVGYDPAVLGVAGFQRNPAFSVTVPNLQFDRDEDGVPDAVNFVVVSMDGLSAGEGTPLKLADIAWTVVGGSDPGITSTLEVDVPEFYGIDDSVPFPIGASADNGQVTFGIVRVRIDDIMRVAANWGEPATGGNAQLDLVPDGIIDVQDVSVLAEHWRGTWP